MRRLLISFSLLLACSMASAQGIPRAADFSVVCDSLTQRCNRRFRVKSKVQIDKIYLRGEALDLYFGSGLSDYPWHGEDILWFLSQLNSEGEKALQGYSIGSCNASGCRLEELETPVLTRSGKSPEFRHTVKNTAKLPLVRRTDARRIARGLSGRHIALWQSHGYYYNEAMDAWRWQRAPLHRTVEDMYTQSYVLDFVIPMLENAGAYVMTPRERDVQRNEVICDNDSTFERSGDALLRVAGAYSEEGDWEDGGTGFADLKQEYSIVDNPFRTGTFRRAACSVTPACAARWTPDIPERGQYAVYVSYGAGRNNSRSANYVVHHLDLQILTHLMKLLFLKISVKPLLISKSKFVVLEPTSIKWLT